MDPRVVDFKSEKRGDGCAEIVVEILGRNSSILASDSSGCDEEISRLVDLSGCGVELVAGVLFLNVSHATMRAPTNAKFTGGIGETIDDGLGIVGGRKHAAILFRFKCHPVIFKPSDRIGRLPAVKGSNKVAMSPGVIFDQVFGIETLVCHVAPASSGDSYLGEDFRTFFQNENLWRAKLGGSDGSKKTCRSATDDDEIVMLFGTAHDDGRTMDKMSKIPECKLSLDKL